MIRWYDPLWPEGSEPTPIVCKATFRRIWQKEFKYIKIGSIAKDTCGTCWSFKSELKKLDAAVARRRSAELEGEPIADETSACEPNSIDFAASNEEVVENDMENNESDNLLNNSQLLSSSFANHSINISDISLAQEEIVTKMSLHVKAFQAQREYAKEKALESKKIFKKMYDGRTD